MAVNPTFWKNKKVLITGVTGFKGAWLALWLKRMGSVVSGYSLTRPTEPSFFNLLALKNKIDFTEGDVRDLDKLRAAVSAFAPDIVFHLAAQALVLKSYEEPVETYQTNVLGTVNVLEALRNAPGRRAVVSVTSDKCYDNKGARVNYKETDPLGGYDPYSSSKACAEIVSAAYRNSFFNPADYAKHETAIATARAGNVIGGGDWAENRLVPDCVRAIVAGKPVDVRNPMAVRPWQHVLESLGGYLMLAEKLYGRGPEFCKAYNFGPDEADGVTVRELVSLLCAELGARFAERENAAAAHEEQYLALDNALAKSELGWRPVWSARDAVRLTAEWTKVYLRGGDLNAVSLSQLDEYEKLNGKAA
ncbi:MAG: CDP-glucose 4,6-dehydratase [Elusimicrobiaceae bacterium]